MQHHDHPAGADPSRSPAAEPAPDGTPGETRQAQELDPGPDAAPPIEPAEEAARPAARDRRRDPRRELKPEPKREVRRDFKRDLLRELRTGVSKPRQFMHDDLRWVRYGLQPVVDGSVEPMAHELQFRWSDATARTQPPPSPYGASLMLSHALLDGGLGERLQGRLFVEFDDTTLLSPVADALCGAIGTIQLSALVPVTDPMTRRLAQLHARGYRFALAGISSLDDPRWCWMPLMSYIKIDVRSAPPAVWQEMLARARRGGLRVIADRLRDPQDYLTLGLLGVQYFQGDLIAPVHDELARALPCCDMAVLQRLHRLTRHGASRDALALVASADPSLVIRLLMLHRIYGPRRPAPATLIDAIEALPADVLNGWIQILRASTFDTSQCGRAWSLAVREQIYNYRSRLIGARACRSPYELETRVFDLYRRLCSRELLVSVPPPGVEVEVDIDVDVDLGVR